MSVLAVENVTKQLPLTLTVSQMAEIMGIGLVTAYSLVHAEGFPKVRIGRRLVIPTQAFMEWLNKKAIA